MEDIGCSAVGSGFLTQGVIVFVDEVCPVGKYRGLNRAAQVDDKQDWGKREVLGKLELKCLEISFSPSKWKVRVQWVQKS